MSIYFPDAKLASSSTDMVTPKFVIDGRDEVRSGCRDDAQIGAEKVADDDRNKLICCAVEDRP